MKNESTEIKTSGTAFSFYTDSGYQFVGLHGLNFCDPLEVKTEAVELEAGSSGKWICVRTSVRQSDGTYDQVSIHLKRDDAADLAKAINEALLS